MTAMQRRLREISGKQAGGCRRNIGKRYTGALIPEVRDQRKNNWAVRKKWMREQAST